MSAPTDEGVTNDLAELVDQIKRALAGADGAYIELVPGDAADVEGRIALVRSCGRKAGREMGVRVQTVATDENGILRLGGMAIATRDPDGARDVHVLNLGPLNPTPQ